MILPRRRPVERWPVLRRMAAAMSGVKVPMATRIMMQSKVRRRRRLKIVGAMTTCRRVQSISMRDVVMIVALRLERVFKRPEVGGRMKMLRSMTRMVRKRPVQAAAMVLW